MVEIEDRVNIEMEIFSKISQSKFFRKYRNQNYFENIENTIQNDKNRKITILYFSIQN